MLIEARDPSWQASFVAVVCCSDKAKAEESPASKVSLRAGAPSSEQFAVALSLVGTLASCHR